MTDPKRMTFGPEKCNNGAYLSAQDPKGQWIFDPSFKINVKDFCENDDQKIQEPN